MMRPITQWYHQKHGWEDPDIEQTHQDHQEEIQINPETENTDQKDYLIDLKKTGKEQMKKYPLTPIQDMEVVEMMTGMIMEKKRIRRIDQNPGGQLIEEEMKNLTNK